VRDNERAVIEIECDLGSKGDIVPSQGRHFDTVIDKVPVQSPDNYA
jgi:hypothetical protein